MSETSRLFASVASQAMELLIPTRALRWGRLTIEPYVWHVDMLQMSVGNVQRDIGRALAPVVEEIMDRAARAVEMFADLGIDLEELDQ